MTAADEGPRRLPTEFVDTVRHLDYRSASLKINVALSELPDFTALPGRVAGPQHRGTIHISPTMDYIERAFDDAKYGWPSTDPILEITLPSSVDPTIAPPGQHVMNIFVQYAPYNGLIDKRLQEPIGTCREEQRGADGSESYCLYHMGGKELCPGDGIKGC